MGILRLWLAIIVVLTHCPSGLLGKPLNGALAVSAFYVISGFYIQLIVTERYSGHAGWQWDFWASRLLRLFPAYWLVLGATAIYIAVTGHYLTHPVRFHADVFQDGTWFAKAYYVLTNIFIVGQDVARWVTFDHGTLALIDTRPDDWKRAFSSFMLVGQAWSIAVELSFYLVAPWLLKRSSVTLIAIAAASTALRLALLAKGLDGQDWWNAFFPVEIGTFCIGALACRFYWARLHNDEVSPIPPWLAGAIILVVSMVYYLIDTGWSYAIFVVFIACVTPILFRYTRNSRLDRFIGDLSYPVYIAHFLVIGLLGDVGVSDYAIGAAAVTASIALAIPLALWIDRPLSAYRHRRFVVRRNEGRGAPQPAAAG